MRFAGVPPRVLAPLQQLRLKATHRDPTDFIVAATYGQLTEAALKAQESLLNIYKNYFSI